MKTFRFVVLILLAQLILAETVFCAVSIDADDPNIQYIGRFDFTAPKAPAFTWSGTHIFASFTGTSCKIKLQDSIDLYFNVFIDGEATASTVIVTTTTNMVVYTVASGRAPGTHTVKLVRRCEGFSGKSYFYGFILDDGASLVASPARPNTRIEFYGDSFTCGFGNLATSTESFKNSTEDAHYCYGPVVCRGVGADYSLVCRSGRGIVKNYGETAPSAEPMPGYYAKTHFRDTGETWKFSWMPNIIVVFLGINDFSSPAASQAQFETAYRNFVSVLSTACPNAEILCMYMNSMNSAGKGYIQNVVTYFNGLGNNKVHFGDVEATLINPTDLGASGHPNVSGHQKIANALTPIINSIMSGMSPTISFSASAYGVNETSGSAVITVTKAAASTGTVTVQYATSNATAVAGSDYTARSGTLSWAAGDATNRTFTIGIINDTSSETNETINLTLSNVTGGAALGSPDTAVLTIVDNDNPGTVQFGSANYSIWEASASVTIAVTRTGGSGGSVSVQYAVSDGTAVAGSDYTFTGGTLTWVDGDSANKIFSVQMINDTAVEAGETLNLKLSNPAGGVALGTPNSAVVTITDNDSSGTVDVSTPPAKITVKHQNLVSATQGGSLKFELGGTTGSTEFKIYTISGKLVRTIYSNSGEADWNFLNDTGGSIKPGIYIYTISDSNRNRKTGKLVIGR